MPSIALVSWGKSENNWYPFRNLQYLPWVCGFFFYQFHFSLLLSLTTKPSYQCSAELTDLIPKAPWFQSKRVRDCAPYLLSGVSSWGSRSLQAFAPGLDICFFSFASQLSQGEHLSFLGVLEETNGASKIKHWEAMLPISANFLHYYLFLRSTHL